MTHLHHLHKHDQIKYFILLTILYISGRNMKRIILSSSSEAEDDSPQTPPDGSSRLPVSHGVLSSCRWRQVQVLESHGESSLLFKALKSL